MLLHILKRYSEAVSPPELLYRKSVIKNVTKFIKKHLCRSLFFNKVVGLQVKNTFLHRTPLVACSDY